MEEVVRASRDWTADIVYWNREYEPRATAHDGRVQQALARIGVPTRTFKDHVVFEAEEVRGITGEPMQHYSAYRTRWWTKWQASRSIALPVPKPIPTSRPVSSLASSILPSADELGYEVLTP